MHTFFKTLHTILHIQHNLNEYNTIFSATQNANAQVSTKEREEEEQQ